jgi:hypothetical protein
MSQSEFHARIGPQLLVSSIKVEVKRKNLPCGCNFSSFAAPSNEQDLF